MVDKKGVKIELIVRMYDPAMLLDMVHAALIKVHPSYECLYLQEDFSLDEDLHLNARERCRLAEAFLGSMDEYVRLVRTGIIENDPGLLRTDVPVNELGVSALMYAVQLGEAIRLYVEPNCRVADLIAFAMGIETIAFPILRYLPAPP